MESGKKPETHFYRPELDVVRFLAFVFVFFFHILPEPSDPRIFRALGSHPQLFVSFSSACGFGLSLFFTLSAFLICEILLRERRAIGTVQLKQFYIRRILRIWPLYYLGLALAMLMAALTPGSHGDIARLSWFAIFFGAWQLALHGPIHSPGAPLWSISVEEQFYLIAPWAAKLHTRRTLYGFCGLILLVSNLRIYYLGRVAAPEFRVWFDSLVHFECFAAGILLCLILNGRLPRFHLGLRAALFASAFGMWFCSVHFLNSRFIYTANPGGWPLIGGYALAALGSDLMLLAFLGCDAKLLPAWAIYLGRISFGLYVFHEFAIRFAQLLRLGHRVTMTIPNYPLRIGVSGTIDLGLCMGLTVLMAALSYRYFETPFLRMKKRHAIIASQPITDPGEESAPQSTAGSDKICTV